MKNDTASEKIKILEKSLQSGIINSGNNLCQSIPQREIEECMLISENIQIKLEKQTAK